MTLHQRSDIQSKFCLVFDVVLKYTKKSTFMYLLTWLATFVEIDHEIISMFILLPSAESFKKGCCQLQAKVCARSTG